MPQQEPDEESNSSDHHMTERQVLSVAGMRFSVSVEWTLSATFTVKPSRSVNFPEWYYVSAEPEARYCVKKEAQAPLIRGFLVSERRPYAG